MIAGLEDRLSVVDEFADGLANIVERSVAQALFGSTGEDSWIPTAGELFDGRHIDRSVVQELFDLVRVLDKESSVCANLVAAQRNGAWLIDVLFEKGHRLGDRIFETDRRGLDLGQ